MSTISESNEQVSERADVAEVELALTGNGVIPARISEIVGVASSRGWAKGDEYPSRSGQVLKKHSGLWALTCRNTSIAAAAESLVRLVEPHAAKIRTAAQEAQATISIAIWWDPDAGQGGFTLPSRTLKDLAELGERVDFYFPG